MPHALPLVSSASFPILLCSAIGSGLPGKGIKRNLSTFALLIAFMTSLFLLSVKKWSQVPRW